MSCLEDNSRVEKLEGTIIQDLEAEETLSLLRKDIAACKNFLDKEVLKHLYYTKIRPALIIRGLISSYPLTDKRGVELHKEFFRLTSCHPKYMTSLELMEGLTSMNDGLWISFLDFLLDQHILIIEEWDMSLGVAIGSTFFDRSVAFDGSPVIRGECDASYCAKRKKGMACTTIWNHKQEILSLIVVESFDCENSNEAEVIALIVLLKEAIKLGLHKEFFEVCTDSNLGYNVLWGTHRIDPIEKSKSAELYRLLRYMKRYFKNLMPRKDPREKMTFVDGVMREVGYEPLDNNGGVNLVNIIQKTARYLGGEPVFRFVQKCRLATYLDKKRSSPMDLSFEKSCFVEVDDEKNKVDAMWHATIALRPSRLVVITRGTKQKIDDGKRIEDLFGSYATRVDRRSNLDVVTIDITSSGSKVAAPKKTLWVVLDATVPKEVLETKNSFTLFITTPSERDKDE